MNANGRLKQENTSISVFKMEGNVLVVSLETIMQSTEERMAVKTEWELVILIQYTRFYMFL